MTQTFEQWLEAVRDVARGHDWTEDAIAGQLSRSKSQNNWRHYFDKGWSAEEAFTKEVFGMDPVRQTAEAVEAGKQ